MERNSAQSSTSEGVSEPLQRLSSIRNPRDLSLGGVKLNKKVFAPNLNVSRIKSKGSSDSAQEKKEEKRKSKNHKNDRDRHTRNGPNIIKSAGVFSEGLGASERHLSTTGAFGGGGFGKGGGGGARFAGGGGGGGGKGDANVMQKPTIKPNDTVKVDKELEDECIRRAVGDDLVLPEDARESTRRDLPVKLPIADFLTEPEAVQVKTEPDVKVETDVFEEKDIVSLLQSDRPKLILVQLPDSMPGQGDSSEDNSTNGETDEQEKTALCRLASLAEGRMGVLNVHRSGRVRLQIGQTTFDVIMGTKAMHHQEVVSVAVDPPSRSAMLTSLGPLHHKLTIVPNWESLLRA